MCFSHSKVFPKNKKFHDKWTGAFLCFAPNSIFQGFPSKIFQKKWKKIDHHHQGPAQWKKKLFPKPSVLPIKSFPLSFFSSHLCCRSFCAVYTRLHMLKKKRRPSITQHQSGVWSHLQSNFHWSVFASRNEKKSSPVILPNPGECGFRVTALRPDRSHADVHWKVLSAGP